MTGQVRWILGKIVALGLLAAVALLAYTALISPLAGYHADLEARIAEQRFLLGRLKAAELKGPDAGSEARATDDGPVFLAGESDSIRIAGLQSLIGDIAAVAGARLSSSQTVEAREERAVRLVGIETQLIAELDQLQAILYAIETAKPVLFVDELNVTASPESSGPEARRLTVRLVVLGAAPKSGS